MSRGDLAFDPLNVPTYSLAEAGRLAGLSPQRVRCWLKGYQYEYLVGPNRTVRHGAQPPVVGNASGSNYSYASFLDLMDMLVVKQCVDRGLTLQRVRKAVDGLREITGVGHFAQRDFFVFDGSLFTRLSGASGDFVDLLVKGQRAIRPVIEQIGLRIDFSDVTPFLAEKWFPLGRSEPIVVDPRVAFGAPSVVDRGIKTTNVYDLYVAEGKRLEVVCQWLRLTQKQVQAAVEFERQLLAAA